MKIFIKATDVLLRSAQAALIAGLFMWMFWLIVIHQLGASSWWGYYWQSLREFASYVPQSLPPESFWYPFQPAFLVMRLFFGMVGFLFIPMAAIWGVACVITRVFVLGWDLSISIADVKRLALGLRKRLRT